MAKEIRQGIGLALIGVVLFLLSAGAADSPVGGVVNGAGFLFIIGGLIVAAVGFFKTPQRD